jgi:hypothetical protein
LAGFASKPAAWQSIGISVREGVPRSAMGSRIHGQMVNRLGSVQSSGCGLADTTPPSNSAVERHSVCVLLRERMSVCAVRLSRIDPAPAVTPPKIIPRSHSLQMVRIEAAAMRTVLVPQTLTRLVALMINLESVRDRSDPQLVRNPMHRGLLSRSINGTHVRIPVRFVRQSTQPASRLRINLAALK